MRTAHHRAAVGLAAAIALAAAFLAATLGGLAAQPAYAHDAAPLRQRPAGLLAPAAETLSMVKLVTTNSGDNSIAFNGQPITYTIIITNNSTSHSASAITVLDILPPGTLDQINCLSPCQPIFTSQQVPEPLGGTVLVTVTTELSWTVASLAPQASTQLTFVARVVGQSDGSVFKNQAFATYLLNGAQGATSTPETVTTARAQLGQTGGPSLANAPTWFSSDQGGTLSQDWGDFNGDGQLDLVLGSSLGVSVYLNQGGRPTPYWNNFSSHRRAYGVRWADFNHDGKLDIVAVGDSANGSAVSPGTNYIYGQVAGGFAQGGLFGSDYQLVRVAVADFTGDGFPDIVASTNSLNAPCPVKLFINTGNFTFAPGPFCVSYSATAALAAGDFDNDGRPDLAVGEFPNTIRIIYNLPPFFGLGPFYPGYGPTVDINVPFLPYDFAWGDFNGDGLLDLAAAFPLQKEARIYQNSGGWQFNAVAPAFHTTKFLSPLSVAWGDFNGDGQLDLAVADETAKVYLNFAGKFDQVPPLAATTVAGQVWSLRAVQVDQTGDSQLSLTNRDGPSLLFDSFSAHLAVTLASVGSQQPASSLALGDVDGSGTIDMLLGAASLPAQGTEIDTNANGVFLTQPPLPSGPGPQSVALGDVDGHGQLDVAVGTTVEAQLYQAGQKVWTASVPNGPTNYVVAFCDVNSDGRLDLLVGANGSGVAVYLNQGSTLAATPSFVTPDTGNMKAIACADFQRNHYPGFAVAFYNQPVHVYGNNRDGTFTSAFTSPSALQTTSLAWGDFNGDGWPDLAVGNYGQGTQIYENYAGHLQPQPIWTSPTHSNTTSIAWGDWNNDGMLELAIGNDGQPAQVYGNWGSSPGQPRLFWIWTSTDAYQTTGVAWGDFSGDGQLDLGLSQKGACCNGYYRNGSITASHLNSNFVQTMALPINPDYLYVKRPGITADGYGHSASEILGGPSQPTVTVAYSVYDPNGSRQNGTNAPGNTLAKTYFDYSLDGGSHWLTATAAVGWPGPIATTSRLGISGTFVWDVIKDQAISDDARFRVRVVPSVPVGPVASGSAVAASPPFIVRGVTCVWPENPSMTISQNPISPTVPVAFSGAVLAGSGQLTYTWNFGDATGLTLGQVAQHTFTQNGIYTVTLTVSGQPCPQNRDVVVSQPVLVGSGPAPFRLYLPILVRNAVAARQAAPLSATTTPPVPPGSASPRLPERTAVLAGLVGGRPQLPPVVSASGRPASSRPMSSAPALAPVQVTTSTVGINNEPSLNGDGTRIAYWSTANPTGNNSDGNIEVFLLSMDTGGVTVTQITSSTGSILGGFNLSPSIDQAGNRVAFFADRDLIGQNPDQNFEIFLYDASTGVLSQVTQTAKGYNILPSISGDGQFIAFASDRDLVAGANPNGSTQIFRAHILPDGSVSFLQVTNTSGGVNDQPSINGDGSRIAFVSDHNASTTRNIYLADIGPGGQVTITQVTNTTQGNTGEPSLDASGQRLAFVSDQAPGGGATNPYNTREIFYADVDAAHNVTITRATTSQVEVGNDKPSISGDGTRIGYIAPNSPITTNVPITGQVRIYDTVLRTEITASLGSALNVALSGDGTVLAFALNPQLYVSTNRLANLNLSKVASPGTIFQGQMFTFTVVLTNTGPSPAVNVILTDTLGALPTPSGVSPPGWTMNPFTFDSAVGGVCGPALSNPIVCTISSLPAHSSVTLTVSLTPTTYGALNNTALVTTDTPQRFATAPASVTVAVQPLPVGAVNLSLTGPNTGTAYVPSTFIANVTPITASVPLTYIWQATNQAGVTLTSTLFTNSQVFAWNPGGVQVVTVTVTNAANNVVTATRTITIFNPVPALSSMVPVTALVNSPPVNLVLTGTGFVANSSVLWDGASIATGFVTSASLTATVPSTDLTSLGTFTVAVSSPGPGGGQSSALPFLVEYPAPSIASIQPITAATGGLTFTLNLTGSNFISGARLFFGSQPSLTTFFSSSNLLTASIPASYLLSPGMVSITVTNPSPSAGPSNAASFTVVTPTLSLAISPAAISKGQTAVLTATISDPQAANRSITLASSNNSIASVPASVILPAGISSVTATVTGVGTPAGGFASITGTLPIGIGGASGSASIAVNNPRPTITLNSPVTATAGGLTFTLTLTGSNFVSGASLYWGSRAPLNLAGSGSLVSVAIPASYIGAPGSVIITATNPLPNDGPSLPFGFSVVSPTISLTPSSLTLGANVTATITATISALQAADQVIALTQSPAALVNAPAVITLPHDTFATTFVVTGGSGTGVLTAMLPAGLGGLADNVAITVSNPLPQIGLIVPSTISVSIPVSLDITGNGFVGLSQVRWNNVALTQTQFISPNELTGTVPVALYPATGAYTVTVFNPPTGGGTSSVVTVTAVNPAPLLTTASPLSVALGTPGFTLVVTGTRFSNGASILWNGLTLTPTQFVSPAQLTASVPSADFPTGGVYTVTVRNPAPPIGGVLSTNFVTVTVNNPPPVITSVSPLTLTHAVNALVTITGTSFVAGAQVQIQLQSGGPISTYVPSALSSTQIQATILGADIQAAGNYRLWVVNPDPPFADQSNAWPFVVQ